MNLDQELAALPQLTVADLRGRYAQVFGETTRVGNKPRLVKRIAWRLQALAEGDLSERARRRAADLANDADLRLSPPRPRSTVPVAAADQAVRLPGTRNDRLPPAGLGHLRYGWRRVLPEITRRCYDKLPQIYP